MEATGWDIRSAYPFMPLFFIALLLVLVPVAQLLRRTGHNPAWSLLILIPEMNLLGAWLFAFKSWPIQRNGSTQS